MIVVDDTLVDEEVNQWEDICADIVQTEDQAELYIEQASTESKTVGSKVTIIAVTSFWSGKLFLMHSLLQFITIRS